MGIVETRAVALRSYKLAEADKIVVWFTETAGVVRSVARGARRLKSRFGAGIEPWTHGKISYYEKENKELVTLSRVEIEASAFELASDTEIFRLLEYTGELVLEFAPAREANRLIFRLITSWSHAVRTTRVLAETVTSHQPSGVEVSNLVGVSNIAARRIVENDQREIGVTGEATSVADDSKSVADDESVEATVWRDAAQVYMEIWMLRLAGFLPDVRRCAVCGETLTAAFYGGEPGVRCAACARASDRRLAATTVNEILTIQKTAPEAYLRRTHTGTTLREVGDLTAGMIRRALERVPRGQQRV